jgi:hypothetical protein
MRLSVVLCDAAQAAEGKLYVLGGGWTHAVGGQPMSCALAVVAAVPWGDANRQHHFAVSLKDLDGNPITQQTPMGEQEVGNEGQFEVGRPAGIKAGSDLNAVLVFKFAGLQLEPGGYVWELTVGDVTERTPFWVVGGNA